MARNHQTEALSLAKTRRGRAHLLSVVDGGGASDEWSAAAGFHFVNVVLYFRSTHALPEDLVVDDVWLDEQGAPVTGAE